MSPFIDSISSSPSSGLRVPPEQARHGPWFLVGNPWTLPLLRAGSAGAARLFLDAGRAPLAADPPRRFRRVPRAGPVPARRALQRRCRRCHRARTYVAMRAARAYHRRHPRTPTPAPAGDQRAAPDEVHPCRRIIASTKTRTAVPGLRSQVPVTTSDVGLGTWDLGLFGQPSAHPRCACLESGTRVRARCQAWRASGRLRAESTIASR